jgi:hypothetical protein
MISRVVWTLGFSTGEDPGRDFLGQFRAHILSQLHHVTARVELNDIRVDHFGLERKQSVNHLPRCKTSRFAMRYCGR